MFKFQCDFTRNMKQVQKQQKSQARCSKTKQTQQRMCRKSEINFYHTPTSSQYKDSGKSSSDPNCSSSSSNTNNSSRLNGQQYANVNNQNANQVCCDIIDSISLSLLLSGLFLPFTCQSKIKF